MGISNVLKCEKCGMYLVEISRETLNIMLGSGMTVHSITKNIAKGRSKEINICPECDAYALGLDFEKGVPIKTQDGRVLVIQDIEKDLWVKRV